MIKINLLPKVKGSQKKSSSKSISNLSVSQLFEKLPSLNIDWNKIAIIRRMILPVIVCISAKSLLDHTMQVELEKLDVIVGQISSEIQKKNQQLEESKSLEPIKQEIEKDENCIRTKLEVIQKLIQGRDSSLKLLLALSSTIPKDLWLSELKITLTEGKLIGNSLGFDPLSDFLKSLKEDAYFESVELKSSKQEEARFEPLNQRVEVTKFEIAAKKR